MSSPTLDNPARVEYGPMSADEVALLRALQNGIEQSIRDGLTFKTTLRNLTQEIADLAHSRSAIWASREANLDAMAADPEVRRELQKIEDESRGTPVNGPGEP